MSILPLSERFSPLGDFAGELHLAIGVFDGIHLGHQAVIAAAQQAQASSTSPEATVAVVTFEPHPIRVLAPERAPRMLASHEHKLLILNRLGISQVLTLPFDEAFAQLSAEDFLHHLLQASSGRLASISVGTDWRFGAKAQGNFALLEEFGQAHSIQIKGVERIAFREERISSTRIRAAIQDGNFELASALFGRPYTVLGQVNQGQQLGRKIGFPTANLRVFSEQLPPSGVYAVHAKLIEAQSLHTPLPSSSSSTSHQAPAQTPLNLQGVANLGTRPTIGVKPGQRRLEVHLFDFEQEIYDAYLEVQFLDFLRPEQRFESLDALKAQIQQDARKARQALS